MQTFMSVVENVKGFFDRNAHVRDDCEWKCVNIIDDTAHWGNTVTRGTGKIVERLVLFRRRVRSLLPAGAHVH